REATDPNEALYGIAVVDVATSKQRDDLGPDLINGAGWMWSPDGLSILELPATPPGDGHILIINATTGVIETAPWTNVAAMNWQRTLP
ncbi:MAG TPA: hypothetical protein VKC59_02395, partial [Candidatus Limnocylindrales bacterium]|nr:hypothetical protein [Candidatus Limnocylindrales bacterium]